MHLNSSNLIPWRVTETLGVRKQGAVSALAHWATGRKSSCSSQWLAEKEAAGRGGSSGGRGSSQCIAMLQLLQEPSVQRDGEGENYSTECPWSSQGSVHMLCSGRTQGCVWDLCVHTAWRGTLTINLKWKHLIVSCINNSLVLSHQQWQWAAVKPNHRQNGVLAEQSSACGRQQSCPHLFPSTAVWARLSLCVPFSHMGLSLSTADHFYHYSDHKLFPLHTPEALWTVSILVPTSWEREKIPWP